MMIYVAYSVRSIDIYSGLQVFQNLLELSGASCP